ncbi:MAG TPA: hypothetical protein VMF08_16815 [Candidatus Sulfotelmatobacter sp.]|nr:hypothetical protein [Candidatus Sulfotelmatobacter sp.]
MRDFMGQLRGRLLKLRCPTARIERLVHELADHREDLKQAGLAEGLSEADAEARADASLGDPLVLAEQTMMSVRRSTWWGRHCVVTFGLLPILACLLWYLMLLCEMLLVYALGYGCNREKLHVAASNPVTLHHLLLAFRFTDYFGVVLVALLFFWLAQRTAVKLRWMVISCAIWSLMAVIFWAELKPNTITASETGLTLTAGGTLSTDLASMPWFRATIPVLVAGAGYVIQCRAVRRRLQRATAG